MADDPAGDFRGALACLIEPALDALAAGLGSVGGLGSAERAAIRAGAGEALYDAAHRKVSRVLVLELNAARVTGALTAADPASRWAEFLALAGRPGYWDGLSEHYPQLPARLRAMLARRCAAARLLADRLACDRTSLAALTGRPPGELTRVSFGAGDSHRGGQTVAVLDFAAGTVVYKPRPVQVDKALSNVLGEVLAGFPAQTRIRVPQVVARDGYGWAAHVAHRYCAGPGELAAFYRGIGHWLAIMRLLGGSDLHAENLIASGPTPVVVDCETLFTPVQARPPSGLGDAFDLAAGLVKTTVLRTGLLPNRGAALGWRGVDFSAVGGLPGQQPSSQIPVITDAGTDLARVGSGQVALAAETSHPSPEPTLARYWDQVLAGFTEVTGRLCAMDRAGELAPLLAGFAGCQIRVVPRATEVYAELARMLWHPVSLHDPEAAASRARDLLAQAAGSEAPGEPEIIAAEVADLLDGDVPYFSTTPGDGRVAGPSGTAWLPEQDLVADALNRWRNADFGLERQVIRATLVSAYLNEGWLPAAKRIPAGRARLAGLDLRRRRIAASMVDRLCATAVRGHDGTVTWIAPVLHPTGWAVQPSSLDTYGGIHGVAVVLAAHLRERRAGRADRVRGAAALLGAALRTARLAEDRLAADRLAAEQRSPQAPLRPPPPGGFVGLGSQIWAWLTLHRWGAADDGLTRAQSLAELVPAAVAADERHELLTGMAGAIVPLLQLAQATRQDRWLAMACSIGDRLIDAACRGEGGCRWPSPLWPDGIGGFAHGVTGIGWALARLSLASGDRRFGEMAAAAFGFEDALYDPAAGGWRDLRRPGQSVAAWCHGAVGIGLSAADLARRGWAVPDDLVGRAVAAARREGFGWGHSLCHGDLGCWELLAGAHAAGTAPPGLPSPRALTAKVVSSIERNGPVTGLSKDTFTPGLLPGLGGIAYQLLRMHPESDLPSVLTLAG